MGFVLLALALKFILATSVRRALVVAVVCSTIGITVSVALLKGMSFVFSLFPA
jgi:hypothetical protein